jgi:hypothetical protein
VLAVHGLASRGPHKVDRPSGQHVTDVRPGVAAASDRRCRWKLEQLQRLEFLSERGANVLGLTPPVSSLSLRSTSGTAHGTVHGTAKRRS